MKFRPLHDRVAVEPMEQEEKSAGGVIIPDTAKEKPMQGKVVAVGDGAKGDDGKKVPFFNDTATTEISIEGQTVLVMRESDVMGVVA